jgi:hypothetical protein
MIESMLGWSKIITWILRVFTFVVMVLAVYLFFSPIVEITGSIPIVGGFIKS